MAAQSALLFAMASLLTVLFRPVYRRDAALKQ